MLSNSNKFAVNSPSYQDENVEEFGEKDEKLRDKILTHSKFKFSVVKMIQKESVYLKSRKWRYINEDEESFIKINFEIIKKTINERKINGLIEDFKKVNLNDILKKSNGQENNYTIETLNSLNDLIMRRYHFSKINKDQQISDKKRLKQMVFKYRKILNDGNSFYRGIIFNFLENIIFSKNILLMKEILILFIEKIANDNPKIEEKEYLIEKDINNVINILYIIIKYMELQFKKKLDVEMTPYIILLKAFLFCQEFDKLIIFFTRYLIFEYIQDNKQKFISENNKNKILDFIPKKYNIKENRENDFYNDLIRMNNEAINDTIYSYIVPYVFNCTLDVITYIPNPDEAIIENKEYVCEKHTEYELNLLFDGKDYDIFYKEYFYSKNYKELDNFIYNNENDDEFSIFSNELDSNNMNNNNIRNTNRRTSSQYPNEKTFTNLKLSTLKKSGKNEEKRYILKCSDNMKKNSIINNGKIYTNNSINNFFLRSNTMQEKELRESYIVNMAKRGNQCHKSDCPNRILEENILNFCESCKIDEMKSYILQAYLTYLQQDINNNCSKSIKQYFSEAVCPITEKQNIPLIKLIEELKLDFDDLFTKVRINICLWCGNYIEDDNHYIELPCKCKLCSKNCFDQYIKLVDDKNDKVILEGKKNDESEIIIIPMTECRCGYEFKLKDYVYMIKLLQKKKLNSCISIYERQIKNHWKWICVFCKRKFSKKIKFIKIYFIDEKLDSYIIDNIDLKHLMCEKCALNKKIKIEIEENFKQKVLCEFCQSEHTIEKIKKVDENNKTESQCIII